MIEDISCWIQEVSKQWGGFLAILGEVDLCWRVQPESPQQMMGSDDILMGVRISE